MTRKRPPVDDDSCGGGQQFLPPVVVVVVAADGSFRRRWFYPRHPRDETNNDGRNDSVPFGANGGTGRGPLFWLLNVSRGPVVMVLLPSLISRFYYFPSPCPCYHAPPRLLSVLLTPSRFRGESDTCPRICNHAGGYSTGRGG